MPTIKLLSQKHNHSPRRTIYFVVPKQNLLVIITKKIDKTQKLIEETCRVSFGRKITGDETTGNSENIERKLSARMYSIYAIERSKIRMPLH